MKCPECRNYFIKRLKNQETCGNQKCSFEHWKKKQPKKDGRGRSQVTQGAWILKDEEGGIEEEDRLSIRGWEFKLPAFMIESLSPRKDHLPDWAASYAGMTFENPINHQRIMFTDTRMIFLNER